MATHQPKTLRIIRVVTTVTDVDMTLYFDFHGAAEKRQWTVEEAIAYERSRGQQDKHDAFEIALACDMTGFVQSYDIITDVSQSIPDERTADEKTADDLGTTYLTPSRDAIESIVRGETAADWSARQ